MNNFIMNSKREKNYFSLPRQLSNLISEPRTPCSTNISYSNIYVVSVVRVYVVFNDLAFLYLFPSRLLPVATQLTRGLSLVGAGLNTIGRIPQSNQRTADYCGVPIWG